MISLQEAIVYFLYGIAGLSTFCFLLLALLYWRRERRDGARWRQIQEGIRKVEDIRDAAQGLLQRQQQSAHAFEDALEKKMGVIKQLLGQSLHRNAELYERQQALRQEMDDLEAYFREHLRNAEGAPRSMAGKGVGTSVKKTLKTVSDAADADRAPSDDDEQSLFQTDSDTEGRHDDEAPDIPADGDRAREGFRALLDMEPKPRSSLTIPSMPRASDSEAEE